MKLKLLTKLMVCVLVFQILTGNIVLAGKQTIISYSPIGVVRNTPSKNIFELEGSNKKFILLDTNGEGKSKYFVMAYDSYAAAQFDPNGNQKFDLEDENNVANLMNKALMGEKTIAGYDVLPKEIIEFINKEQTWSIDAGYEFSDFEVVCPLSFLSAEEYTRYMGKFGIVDEIQEQSGRPGWWLRSARGYDATKEHVLMAYITSPTLGATVSWEAWGVLAVRPCFYLDESFFASNKFNTKHLGENVKKEIIKGCDDSKLNELGYSEEEIKELYNDTEFMEKASLMLPDGGSPWYDINELDVTAKIDLVSDKDKNYIVSFYVDNEKKYEENVLVKGRSTKKLTFNTGYLNNNKHTVTLVINDGKEEIKRINKTFHVLTGYKETFMEEYSKHGFNHHLRLASSASGVNNELEALEKMGVLMLRDGVQWNGIEPDFKKRYNFSAFEPWMTEFLKRKNTSVVFLFAFNNDLYSGIDGSKVGDSVKYTPTTKEEYDNFAEMTNVVLDEYSKIEYAQIWNEPVGAGFWKPKWDVPSYTHLLGVSGAYVKEENPEAQIVAGSVGWKYVEFLEDIADKGIYPYFDLFSVHIYLTPNKAETTDKIMPIDNYLKRNMGGWKKMCATEWGWPTREGVNGSSLEFSAAQTVIQYVLYDEKRYEMTTAYQFNNFGNNRGDREQNFGVVETNRTPKPAAYTVSKFINDMSGAIHVGKMNDDEINLHFYYKDGKPILIAWAKEGVKTLDFGGVGFSATDMYNTPVKVENGKILVNETPVYITGLPKSIMAQAIVDSLMSESEVFYDSYATLTGVEPEFGTKERHYDLELYETYFNKAEEGAYGYDVIKSKLDPELEKIKALVADNRMPDAQEVKTVLDSFYDLGNEFINDYSNGTIKMSERSFFGFLYSLNWMGEYLANLYMTAIDGNLGNVQLDSGEKLQALERELQAEEDKVVGGRYEFCESMIAFTKKYSDMAYNVAKKTENNPSKAGVVKSRELISDRLCEWIENAKNIETIGHTSLIMQMTRKNREFYNFADNKAVVSLYNFGKKDFSGQIKLFDSEGSEVVSIDAELKAGEDGEFSKVFYLKNNTEEPEKYLLQLVSGNEVLLEHTIDDITLKGKSNIRMKPSTRTFAELDTIDFEVDNTFNKEMTVTVSAEAPEGWEFEENTVKTTVKPGESGIVTFKVSKKQKTDFNEYYFSAKAFEGEDQIASISNAPLNFTIVTPATEQINVSAFEGDISSWTTAYPVMVAVPKDPHIPESWKNSTMSMRAYARWDSDYLYVLARVNDETHLNRQTGNTIWNGDAIQISIDGANDKTSSYKSGDYEYGFAITDHGQESEAWYGGNEAFNNMEFKIVRKDDEKMTYYLMKFPKAAVTPLELKRGSVFGMNFVIADCDYVSRDIFEELTEGTAYSKAPSYYYDWYLKGQE